MRIKRTVLFALRCLLESKLRTKINLFFFVLPLQKLGKTKDYQNKTEESLQAICLRCNERP